VEDPGLCDLFNGDVASLVGVNFGNKSLLSCAYCIYLVLVDLEFILYRSTYSSCCTCKDHLQKSSSIIAQLLTQPGSTVSSLILNFVAVSSLILNFVLEISFSRKFRKMSKVSTHRNFLHRVESSFRYAYSPAPP
jgi:hypothetical protein